MTLRNEIVVPFAHLTVHWDCRHIEHAVTACFHLNYKLSGIVSSIAWLASAAILHCILVPPALFDDRDTQANDSHKAYFSFVCLNTAC